MIGNVSIVGVLNVTPDSYFDGGKYDALEAAVAHAEALLEEGADIIDIGGESSIPSGPGKVSEDEELKRVIPVIQEILKQHPGAKISVDTYKSGVAKAATEAGASMINDVSAARHDSEMLSVVSGSDVDLVVMYAKHPPPNAVIEETHYDNVLDTVHGFLQERVQIAVKTGIDQSRIILDPGLGFFLSSDPQYSFEVLKHLNRFADLGCRLYVSPSRKSFLAGPEQLPPSDRLPATIVASVEAVQNGATYIRTHDVAEVRRAIETAQNLS